MCTAWSPRFLLTHCGGGCDDGSALSPSVTPFFFIYHDNCMLSTAPENAAQAVAIKMRHQKEEGGGGEKKSREKEEKKIPSLCCKLSPLTEKFCGSSLPSCQSLEGPSESHAIRKEKKRKKLGEGWTECVKHFVRKLRDKIHLFLLSEIYPECDLYHSESTQRHGSTHPTTGLFFYMLDANLARQMQHFSIKYIHLVRSP